MRRDKKVSLCGIRGRELLRGCYRPGAEQGSTRQTPTRLHEGAFDARRREGELDRPDATLDECLGDGDSFYGVIAADHGDHAGESQTL